MKLTSEEKDKIRKFVTPDLKPAYSLFKDKELHPDNYPIEDHKVAVNKRMLSFLEQFKDKIVR